MKRKRSVTYSSGRTEIEFDSLLPEYSDPSSQSSGTTYGTSGIESVVVVPRLQLTTDSNDNEAVSTKTDTATRFLGIYESNKDLISSSELISLRKDTKLCHEV